MVAFVIALALAAPDKPPTFIYKWRDKKGTLHVTDRFDSVPKELREKFAKLRDDVTDAPKKPAKSGSATVEPVAPAKPEPQKPAETQNSGPSAYEKLMQRQALEKQVRTQAQMAQRRIGDARAAQETLAEEQGNLRSNPVLNAAQPGRVERINDIDKEIAALDGEVAKELQTISELLQRAEVEKFPEEWVTGY